jgi:hypothetical protein
MTKVVPFAAGEGGGIPIAALNPDTDGDGKVRSNPHNTKACARRARTCSPAATFCIRSCTRVDRCGVVSRYHLPARRRPQVEPWEKEVYDRIVAADTDNNGTISVRDLFEFIKKMSDEVKEASKGGIPITSLNPDTDGDGKVEKWEMDVFDRIKKADEDRSGAISVKEVRARMSRHSLPPAPLLTCRPSPLSLSSRVTARLSSLVAAPPLSPQLFGVIKGAAESDKQKKLFQRLFFGATFIIVLLVGAMFVVSIAAGEAIKESKVAGATAEMTALDGSVVSTGQAEVETTIWDMALLTPYELGNLKFFSFYVDLTAVAAYGGWVEFVLQPTGAFKITAEDATFSTAEGHEVAIDSTTSTGTVRFGSGSLSGGLYSIKEAVPADAARTLYEMPSRIPVKTKVTTECVPRLTPSLAPRA